MTVYLSVPGNWLRGLESHQGAKGYEPKPALGIPATGLAALTPMTISVQM